MNIFRNRNASYYCYFLIWSLVIFGWINRLIIYVVQVTRSGFNSLIISVRLSGCSGNGLCGFWVDLESESFSHACFPCISLSVSFFLSPTELLTGGFTVLRFFFYLYLRFRACDGKFGWRQFPHLLTNQLVQGYHDCQSQYCDSNLQHLQIYY